MLSSFKFGVKVSEILGQLLGIGGFDSQPTGWPVELSTAKHRFSELPKKNGPGERRSRPHAIVYKLRIIV